VSGGDDAVRVVCAGDGFISADLLADAVVTALAGAGVPAAPEVVRLQSAWPEVPFGSVDGVREAAGDPAELAAAAVGAHASLAFGVAVADDRVVRLVVDGRGQ